jgi:hypothetical protein
MVSCVRGIGRDLGLGRRGLRSVGFPTISISNQDSVSLERYRRTISAFFPFKDFCVLGTEQILISGALE